ncbi:class I SAM-dependent methyltransferase [Candidatus Omnitrophota bacterium]
MATENEIKNWYNQRHIAKGKDAWRPYEAYQIFLKYLDAKAGKSLLDIGSGTGYLLKAADKLGLNTYGIDISDEGAKIAREVSPNSVILVGNGEDLNFEDKKFDYITCLGALEHFLDINKSLKAMKRVSKKDAKFIIMVPNINNYFWKKSGKRGTEQKDINEHLFSLQEWKKIFINNDFKILRVYQDKWFMRNIKLPLSKDLRKLIKYLVNKLTWIFLPLDRTYQFIFVMAKKN